jgi:hypothetical protein
MMNLNNFSANFHQVTVDSTHLNRYHEVGLVALSKLPEVYSLFKLFSGSVFDDGLLRIHNPGSFYFWTELTFEYFKKFKCNSYCFAFDWIGRQYAVNYNNGNTMILMLDPATAEAFELITDIESFLNDNVDDFKHDILEFERFKILSKKVKSTLQFDQCFGFKRFLFLGGNDEDDNYELNDMEVYWELNYQIYNKTKNLPAGTLIGNISIK